MLEQLFLVQPRGEIVTDGSKNFLDSFVKRPEMLAYFWLLVLGSYRVELGLYEERKMYLKRKICDSNDSTLRQNEVAVFSFFLLTLCRSDLTVSTF